MRPASRRLLLAGDCDFCVRNQNRTKTVRTVQLKLSLSPSSMRRDKSSYIVNNNQSFLQRINVGDACWLLSQVGNDRSLFFGEHDHQTVVTEPIS